MFQAVNWKCYMVALAVSAVVAVVHRAFDGSRAQVVSPVVTVVLHCAHEAGCAVFLGHLLLLGCSSSGYRPHPAPLCHHHTSPLRPHGVCLYAHER